MRATEAAGEGINLQFCHLMINYDMPWNRRAWNSALAASHRIGQRDDCYAFNFVATSGDDGDAIGRRALLQRLLESWKS